MKKITLIMIAAMLSVAQMNATTSSTEPMDAAAPAMTAADSDIESAYEVPRPFDGDNDESTKHWTAFTSGIYLGLGVKHSYDAINNSFESGLLNAIGIKYNTLHGQVITLGAGIHHRSYSMKRPFMLMRGEGSDIVVEGTYPSQDVDKIKKRSSNLNFWAMQFPLMFRQRIVKDLEIGVAGILDWNMFARVDNHYELDKVDHDTHYRGLKQNKVNFDFMGTLTWDGLGFYCRYSPGKFFKDGHGPEIKNTWTLGLMIAL